MGKSSIDEVAFLVAQTGPLIGQRWALRGNLVLGRDETCDIVIADRQVSRQHARLSLTGKGILLEDLGSKNGTHRNGIVIQDSAILEDGDVIQIALAQKFTFLSSDATVPLDDQEYAEMSEHSGPVRIDDEPTLHQTGRLKLEKRSRRVWIGDIEVLPPLSVSQFSLLEMLYENPGQVVPRRELITRIWGEVQAIEVSEQALDALVRRLRDRLASIDPSHNYILTVRGHGLRLENSSADRRSV